MDVAAVGRHVVGLFLLVGAATKVRSIQRFRDSVREQGLLGVQLSTVASVTIPIVELLTAVWLFSGVRSRLAVATAIATIAAFTIYIAVLRLQGRDLPCACFGAGGRLSDPLVTRNVALTSIAAASLNEQLAVYFAAVGGILLLTNIVAMRRALRLRALSVAQ